MEMYYVFIALGIIVLELFIIMSSLLKKSSESKKMLEEIKGFRHECGCIQNISQEMSQIKQVTEKITQNLRVK